MSKKLTFYDDDWDGIESGYVRFIDENDKWITGSYNLEEREVKMYDEFWEQNAPNWESKGAGSGATIDGVEYSNLWEYIILDKEPVFRDENDEEIEIDDYEILFE